MNGFLFEQVIFGPIRSRRLGISLGVNLLPLNRKVCTFNCIYCECGWTQGGSDEGTERRRDGETSVVTGLGLSGGNGEGGTERAQGIGQAAEGVCGGSGFPLREAVRQEMEQKLSAMADKRDMLTNITFAGNGEPTVHPDFPGIVDDTVALRDIYFPHAGISVLSNASQVDSDALVDALMKVDHNILKLDAGTEQTFQRINNPLTGITLLEVVSKLIRFEGKLVIQTLFLRGSYMGETFDNTTDEEVGAWLEHLDRIRPQSVMIYPIARATPIENVEKISHEKLLEIAKKVEALGITAEVYD